MTAHSVTRLLSRTAGTGGFKAKYNTRARVVLYLKKILYCSLNLIGG